MASAALSIAILIGGGLLAYSAGPAGEAGGETAVMAPTTEDAPALPSGAIERALNVADLDELTAALLAAGVSQEEADAATRAAGEALRRQGQITALIVVVPGAEGMALHTLRASYNDGSGILLRRSAEGGFSRTAVAADVSRQVRVLRGELDSDSFYSSAVAAGLVDTLVPEFINAFAYDFNLASEVSPGDRFEVAYEQEVNAKGEPVGPPRLLFAGLTTAAKSLKLYRHQLPGGKAGWFDGNGAITKRGLMRTPIDGARISSKFGMRFHPVLHYNRLHGGVDFAAPVGTPIYAAADATVASASPSRCAGNMVRLNHDNGWQTHYFHLSRYAEGLQAGTRVMQGSTIGFVGNTGTCTTGPHLHYEVHIDGEKRDPLSIPTDDSRRERMSGSALAGFMRERDRIDLERARQST